MFDNLLDGIKGQIVSAITEKTGIGADQAAETIPLAGESIKEGLMGAVSGGDLSGIMSMFSGGDMQQSSIFQTIASTFLGKLGGLGIGGGSANMVSALALPMIMNKIKGAASNEAGQVDQSGLMSLLGGGDAAGMLGALTGAMGSGAGALGALTGALGGAKDTVAVDAEEDGDLVDDLKDKAMDALKGGFGKLFG